MRPLVIFSLLLALTNSLCCHRPPAAEPTVTSIEIILDLEDNQYLLEGQWHPAHLPLVGCTPDFNLHFDWEDDRLQLRYCAEAGNILTETITLGNNNCQLAPTGIAAPVLDHGYVRIDFLLDENFGYCLRENNDLLCLHFDFD